MFDDLPAQYKAAILASVGAKSVGAMSDMATVHKDSVIGATKRLFEGLSINKTDTEQPIKWA